MKDFIGQDLSLGDKVIIPKPGYNILCLGTVVQDDGTRIRVEYNYNNDYIDRTYIDTNNRIYKPRVEDIIEFLLKN